MDAKVKRIAECLCGIKNNFNEAFKILDGYEATRAALNAYDELMRRLGDGLTQAIIEAPEEVQNDV